MKKIIALILVLALGIFSALALASCAGKDPEPVVKLIDVALTSEEYAYMVEEGNTALQSDMNAFLAEIKENGKFQEILDKYFSGEGEKCGYSITTGDVENTAKNFVVATNCPFEPFEYIGSDGKAYGVDIEVAAAYAESRGLNLVIKNIDFDAIFLQVDSGLADIGMAGITVDEEREASYDFTTTYYNASQKLIVAADNTAFDNCKTAADVENVIKALTGKKFGYQVGTTGGMYVEGDEDWGYAGFQNLEGKGYSTAFDAANDLVNGVVYAVVVDDAPANAIVKAMNGN